MKMLMKNWKLTKKFLVSILLALLLVFSAMAAILSLHEKKVLVEELTTKGTTLRSFLRVSRRSRSCPITSPIWRNYVVDVGKRDADVTYAVVLDKDGNPLTHQREEPKDKTGMLEFKGPVVQANEQIGMVKMGLSTASVQRAIRNSQAIILALSLGAMVAISLIVFVLFRIIALRPISELKSTMAKVASGDLTQTVEVTTNDELGDLGRATNKMVGDLKGLISDIRHTAGKTASSAEQIAASSKQVKQGSATTSQAAEETLTSMEEMAASIQSVAKNADALSANVQETSSSVTQMMTSVENVARNMDSLASSVSETSSTIEQMTVTTDQVAKNMEALASNVVETSSTVEEMTVSIEQVAKGAEDLSKVVQNAATSVEQMAKSVEQVGKHIQEAGSISQRSVDEAKAGGEALSRRSRA